MTALAHVEGLAFWAPGLPDWESARAAFASGRMPEPDSCDAPKPLLLAAGDRRRAPAAVALALEVGRMAIESAGYRGDELPSVFTSAHGDLAIVDSMCATLARAPTQVSPTRFLNSIHNAPAGMWSMAANCMRAGTAVTAGEHSLAAGLLETLVQCESEQRGVLLVACETAATGPLVRTIGSRIPVAFGAILTPRATRASVASMAWSVDNPDGRPRAARAGLAQWFARTGLAGAVDLIEALALRRTDIRHLQLPGGQVLSLQLSFPSTDGRQDRAGADEPEAVDPPHAIRNP